MSKQDITINVLGWAIILNIFITDFNFMDWKKWSYQQFSSGKRFMLFVVTHFIADECPYIASSLAFTSLLALVPLMTVGLAIFSSFPAFQTFVTPLQEFIFYNFVPATGQILLSYILQFTSQISQLSIFGMFFLVGSALLMLFTIERAMNKIWRVSKGRHGVPAFLTYWAILSLTPILIGLSIAISSYLFTTPFLFKHPLISFLISHAPLTLSFIGFLLLYTLVPNCKVQIRHSFWGALTAAFLFEMAKQGFAFYLMHYNTYELIYGAFAIVPIFFIWVYCVWIITLLGAEISYALSVKDRNNLKRRQLEKVNSKLV